MMTEEYDDKNGRRVWLSCDEVEALLDVAGDPLRKVAFRLGAEVGRRSHEVVDVRPEEVVDGGEAGKVLVVAEAKGEKLREVPIPDALADTVDAAASFGGVNDDEVLVDRSTRSVRNWVEDAREELAAETSEARWEYLTFHDLRRT
ncbi:site-specific integrase [Halolamina salifodinae]|uniref:Integrase n=1 Tax=Halolamina salifodinae TaxID=1202767 RepID=A0A8T4GXJ2_9EURY|nr:site-specific integrase [Halolamina salifodinae]MBP1985968.1 integrase [Halolamina salifodinae]